MSEELKDWIASVEGAEDVDGRVSRYRLLEEVAEDVFKYLEDRISGFEPDDLFEVVGHGTHESRAKALIEEFERTHLATIAGLQAAIDQRDKAIEGWQKRSDGLEATIEVREQGLREWAEIAEGLKADLEKSESALRTAEQAHATAQHQVAELSKALEPTRILAGLMQQSWQSTDRTLKAALDMNERLTAELNGVGAAYEELNKRVAEIEREPS